MRKVFSFILFISILYCTQKNIKEAKSNVLIENIKTNETFITNEVNTNLIYNYKQDTNDLIITNDIKVNLIEANNQKNEEKETIIRNEIYNRIDIHIVSEPDNANIFVNGEFKGITPTNISLDLDKELIVLKLNGYKDYTNQYRGSTNIFVRMLKTNSIHSFLYSFKCGSQPKENVLSPDGKYLIITLLNENAIEVFDTENRVLKKIKLSQYTKEKGFVEGVFKKDGGEFWFTQMSKKGKIYILDMKSFKIKKVINTESSWTKVGEFNNDESIFFASNWLGNSITVIDVNRLKRITNFDTYSPEPRGIGITKDNRFVYVVTYAGGEILKFDSNDSYRLIKRIKTGGVNGRFRIDYDRNIAYINNMHKNIFFVYDLTKDEIITNIKTWYNPNNLRLAYGGKYIYVSNRGPNNPKSYLLRSPENGRIYIYSTLDNYKLIDEIIVGNQPIGLAIDETKNILYVSNFLDDTIEVYKISI